MYNKPTIYLNTLDTKNTLVETGVFVLKIISQDLKRGYVEVVPENEDDLWILFTIIEKGDVVSARTSREIKLGDKSTRVSMDISLRVEKVEYQSFTDRIRIHGVVVSAPEEYGVKGKHHTINISPGSRLVIFKNKWMEHQLDRISKSSLAEKKVLATTLDYDEACICLVTEQGIKIISEIHSNVPSKRDPDSFTTCLNNYLEEVSMRILEVVKQHGVKIVIVASPGDLASRIASYIEKQVSRVYRDSVSTGGCSGLNELLRRDSVKKAIMDLSIVNAIEVLEEFKFLLIKDSLLIAYGIDDVEYAVRNNAVKKLVLSPDLLRSIDDGVRNRVSELLEEAYRRRAEIIIVPRECDINREINSFGGVIAILRYPLFRNH